MSACNFAIAAYVGVLLVDFFFVASCFFIISFLVRHFAANVWWSLLLQFKHAGCVGAAAVQELKACPSLPHVVQNFLSFTGHALVV